MRGPLAWPLLLLMRRAPLARAGTSSAHEWTRAVRAWTPATGTWTASAHEWTRAARSWTPAARAWTSSALEWTRAARAPTLLSARPGLPGGAGLARAPGRWAGSQGSGLQGGPAAAAGAGTEAGRHGPPASPGEDWRSRPAVAGRSEARKLLGLVRPERGRLAAAVGFLAVSSVVTMSAPFFLGKVIDVIYASPTMDSSASLTDLCLGLTCVFLCGAAANAVRVYLMQSSGQRIVNRLRTSLFSSVLRQDVAFFDKTRTGELINRLSSDTALLGRSVTENLSDGLRAGAQASVGIGMMTGLSGNLIVLSVLYKGGLLMGAAHMTVGELSSFLMYAFWVGLSIGGLSSFYSELMKGLGAGGRLWELLERQPQMPIDEGVTLREKSFQGALQFKNVHFAYPARPEVPIFQDFSLSIPAGSVTALVGPSGSGKSTVVSLLLRLYDPLSGAVLLDGHDIRQLNPAWLRSKIGTVSQEPVLFSCSIAENIAYGADCPSSVTAEQVERAAEAANAAAFIRKFPRAFHTVVGEKGVLLSGGQKQRIAIARALLKNPRILLLDEATSALDAENEYLVQEALDRLMEGRTVLVIAHRLSTIKNADVVAVLDRGKITEHGKHEELLSRPDGLYRRLMSKQSFPSA
ncbi:ATP-binding cassette sub-family B member 10, mitochondrial isoform X2 [Marmota flaviventris]|uniref:ATP-binding cassette sub-family B member 10, mitochondrial isoform X2 n=1 Tax=Marmota flaviventris TaxID=93162 RepID=UPI003A8BF733